MTMKRKIENILLRRFYYVYCDTCRHKNTKICDDCHRKCMNWGLSSNAAEELAEEIITEIIFKEEKYEHCDSYTLNYGKPQCLSTKEMEYCSCEGNKYKCNFYKLVE